MNNKIIIFAPHPGDEIWGCGGTIAKKIFNGYEIFIVIMTDGRYAFKKVLGIEADPSPEEVSEIRKNEVQNALKILGVKDKNIFFLDYIDGMLLNSKNKAQVEVLKILRNFVPEEIFYTYEKDFHIDHQITNIIVSNSIKELNLNSINYKYSILRKNPTIGKFYDLIYNLIKNNIIKIDVSEFLHLKKNAINELKSEIGIISPKQKKPLTINYKEFLKNKETFILDDIKRIIK